jgi:hypothetical protein
MAVRIPIVTVFDPKGLKQAQFAMNKVQGNVRNLGRNLAIAGAAIAGAFALIGKSVQDAAQAQAVFAQTEAVLKSTGTTANGTAQQISALSESLMKLSGFDDEAIQSGNNLILTFKNIQNQAGAGNDIFNRTSLAMVDLARVMRTGPEAQAIRLGKALNDPVRGVTALGKAGVQFTDGQRATIKSLVETGDLLGAQKIILSELESQIGGSAEAYGKTFAGQLDIVRGEIGNLSEEIGVIVMPALKELVTAFRELAPEIGTKLKTALANVDIAGFAKSLADALTFIVQNAEAIMRIVSALFILNTAYNTSKVIVGLYSAATFLLGNVFTVTAGKIGLATGALKLFKIALVTTGIGALIVALGLIVQGATEVDSSYRKTTPVVTSFGTAVLNSGKDAEWAAARYGTAKTAIDQLNVAAGSFKGISAGASAADLAKTFGPLPKTGKIVDPLAAFTATSAKGSAAAKDPTGLKAWIANAKEEAKVTKKETRLINLGLGKDVAANLASGGLSVVNDALKRVTKNGTTAITNLTKRYQGSAAGQAAAAAAASESAAAAASAAAEAIAAAAAAAAEAARREAEILAEKQRVYEAFANSVISTFAGIRDSILSAFSLPQLGGSTDSIIRNMDKLLTRVKAFSSNITKLSSMGLDPKLLQQVINAGPIAGAKLAANLVSGGIGGLNAINAGYAELGNVAGEIGMTGTQSLFNTAAQQAVYNVTVNGGLDSGATIGKAVVDAIRAYERTSGPVFQGA